MLRASWEEVWRAHMVVGRCTPSRTGHSRSLCHLYESSEYSCRHCLTCEIGNSSRECIITAQHHDGKYIRFTCMNNHGPRPESQLTSPESWERWFDIRDDRGLSWNCQNTMPDAVWATHHPPAVTRTCRVRHHDATEHWICVVCMTMSHTWRRDIT